MFGLLDNPFGDLKSYGPEDNRFMNSGSLIAVSYEARARGVKRSMRGAEAKKVRSSIHICHLSKVLNRFRWWLQVCPDMLLVQVPTSHGKADLTIYRDASAKILTVLCNKFSSCTVERASIDEVYIDVSVEAAKHLEENSSEQFLEEAIATLTAIPSLIAGDDTVEVTMSRRQISRGHNGTEMTANSYVSEGAASNVADDQKRDVSAWFTRPPELWSTEDKLLVAGALVVNQLRQAVYDELGFTCSAGIANNKILAKLSSGMHKPNKQTLAPQCVVPGLMKDLPCNRIQGLGGKLGSAIEAVYGERVRTMGQILAVPQAELARHFGAETAQWLHTVSRGIDHEPVVNRALPISIGCSKSFRSTTRLTPEHVADGTVLKWLKELASELQERVAIDTKINSRIPRNLHAGASVKIYAEGEAESLAAAQAAEKEGWTAWFAEEGFHLSKICAMPGNATAETMARMSLQMLTKAIFEHPKFMAAMASANSDGAASKGSVQRGNGVAAASPKGKGRLEGAISGSLCPSPGPDTDAAQLVVATSSTATNVPASSSSRLLWAITGMSMGATQFQTIETGAGSIKSYFGKGVAVSDADAAPTEVQGHNTEVSAVAGQYGLQTGREDSSKHSQPSQTQKRRKIVDMFASAPSVTPAPTASGVYTGPVLTSRGHGKDSVANERITSNKVQASVSTSHAAVDGDDDEVVFINSPDETVVNTSDTAPRRLIDNKSSNGNTNSASAACKQARTLLPSPSYEPQSMGDVDSAVFLTLPPEIQREIELTLRLREQRTRPAQQSSKSGPAPAPAAAGLRAHFGGAKGKPAVPQNAHTRVERATVEHEVRSMADVDSAVFLTLPPDIQREIELTMRLRQQQQRNRTN
jgi:nucleotidyltransferase/DNA polymerase involved in DNA repair